MVRECCLRNSLNIWNNIKQYVKAVKEREEFQILDTGHFKWSKKQWMASLSLTNYIRLF